MNPITVKIKLAKANYKAAVNRQDAASARRHLEELEVLRARKRAMKGADSTVAITEKAARRARKRVKRLEKRAVQNAAVVTGRPDPELEQVRHLRRLVDDRDGEMRRGALEKLRALLSTDELTDVLMCKDPAKLVRTPGPNPRSADAQHAEKVGALVRRVTDRSLPSSERGAAGDQLAVLVKGNRRAEEALARIMLEKVR